jgi:integrase
LLAAAVPSQAHGSLFWGEKRPILFGLAQLTPDGKKSRCPKMLWGLGRAEYHHKYFPHGFRSTFSTIMNELSPADRAVIDFMLAHVPKDKTEVAYNRALHLERRKELSQIYADILMEGAPSALSLLDGPRKILNPENYRKQKAA